MLEKIAKQEWVAGLLDFIFPPICLGCGAFNESENQICENCIRKIETYEYPLCLNCQAFVPKGVVCPICLEKSVILLAYANYKLPLEEIIIQFKFKGITSPARTFADLLCEHFEERLKEFDVNCLVPIPLHPARENRRGYNQAQLIAESISEHTEIPVSDGILIRKMKRRPQARLNFEERMKNIKGVFEAAPIENYGKEVILVDDVVTSGATVLEARRVLNDAGYKVAGIISIAHGV